MTEVLPRAKKQKTASYSTPAESAAADKAAEAVSEEDTGFTEELPPLPFVHQYRSGNFFCARVLREILPICEENASGQQREVRDRDGDTRHRQIGLLRLFFQRFRKEVSNICIVAISHKVLGVNEVVVFKAHREKKKVFFLCDGPPRTFPRAGQMVVFTSPNVEWLRVVRKDDCTIYMPLWTCEELQEAASAVGLKGSSGVNCITDDIIEERFYSFGGVARECLLQEEALAEFKKRDLNKEIEQIRDVEEFSHLVDGVGNRSACHRVLHYVPGEDTRWVDTKLASPFVGENLALHLLKSVKNDKKSLHTSLEGIPEATATRGPYHKPESTRFESINGFYLPKMKPTGSSTVVTAEDVIAWNTDAKNRVILFQMTISMTHPVKASGILSVLEKLGLLEVINSDPKRAALVFVVPKSTTSSFKRQEIVPEATDNSPVKSIKGIGPVAERNLPAKAILSRAQRNLESMRDKTYSEAMAQIPQYAWFTQG
ncbi:hypothetical protein C6341_g20159 [Phytophthora cactorum]|nr:hypothetical protein C6341_g20159 [Phytophthora cactorum]